MASRWDRITDDTYKSWLLEDMTAEEYIGLGPVERRTLRTQFQQQQQQQQQRASSSLSRSPVPSRRKSNISPPSEGKRPPLQPTTKSLRPPSSEEGQANGLRYVALDSVDEHPLYCSANMDALKVVGLLETVRKQALSSNYIDAANFVLRARGRLNDKSLTGEEVHQNERFYTGAFCDGLNAILDEGICVLHQGCIGSHATHSDISARDVLNQSTNPTLMVGEGKADTTDRIRQQTRGQVFNELIRHRKIDNKLNSCVDFRPILLIAFNFNYISLDLAFPSTKSGYMENSEWVTFDEMENGTETFWTIQVAQVGIAGQEGREKLPYVLRFIAATLRYLQNLSASTRVQFKTPWMVQPSHKVTGAAKQGENVTIVETDSGRRVYKEFCYYLRETDNFNFLETKVEKKDQRWPPCREILDALGQPYESWEIIDGPCGIKILVYDYIEGRSTPTSQLGWIGVLKLIEIIHSLGYVHGDLLPRNLLFWEDCGYVIDFDLMRKDGESYVAGYNHKDFSDYRHADARARAEMKREHDVWALKQMSKEFFDVPDIDGSTISDLISYFSTKRGLQEQEGGPIDCEAATGSPKDRDAAATQRQSTPIRSADDLAKPMESARI